MLGGRPGSAEDAVVGVVPAVVVQPETLDRAAEIIATCNRDRKRLVFVGGGTELGIGAPPEGLDVLLRTTALGRLVEHAPLDQIVSVECGMRLADLQRLLAVHGQMLALDPPWPDRATVGGIVAAAAFGPLRSRYGSVRDLIIGVSFIRADGARVRGGGKVVKNVAGYDLPKLLTGSLGTLGLIATVTFRLHPRPETSGTMVFRGIDAPDVRRVIAAARSAQLEPAAVAALRGPEAVDPEAAESQAVESSPTNLGVRFEGFERAVKQQCERLQATARALGLHAEAADQAGEHSFWTSHDRMREAPAQLRLKVATLPADPSSGKVFARLRGALHHPRSVWYPTLGLGFVAGDVGAPKVVASAVTQARGLIAATGGTIVVHEAPTSVRAELDVWGATASPPSSPQSRHDSRVDSRLLLMRSIKQRLDPERSLAPGRFIGGI
jgi:glycolate oxidase FAD binding subunit